MRKILKSNDKKSRPNVKLQRAASWCECGNGYLEEEHLGAAVRTNFDILLDSAVIGTLHPSRIILYE